MTLKLLSFDKTGVILAALTTSIPESIERLEIGIIDFAG